MKKGYKEICIVLFCILYGQESDAEQNNWCQKYPREGLFKDRDIQEKLQTFLTQDQIKKVEKELTVQLPIQCIGNILIIKGCKPHACPMENYTLFLDTKENQNYLCYWKLEEALKPGIKWKGVINFYGNSLSTPMVVKDLEAPLGCFLTDEKVAAFITATSLPENERNPEKAIKALIVEKIPVFN